jgi:predicted MFS family arabinose efflux permease
VLSWVVDRGFSRAVVTGLFLALLVSAVLLFKPQAGGLEGNHLIAVLVPGTLFFVGFSGLEPILPSLVSKTAPENAYGTALGVYNTSQFLGSFAGGSVAGALASRASGTIMTALAAAALAGFLLMLFRRDAARPAGA